MKTKKLLPLLLAMSLFASNAGAMSRPVTIANQGSFFAGGKVVTAPGIYKDAESTNFDGETLHGDAAYVLPAHSRHREWRSATRSFKSS